MAELEQRLLACECIDCGRPHDPPEALCCEVCDPAGWCAEQRSFGRDVPEPPPAPQSAGRARSGWPPDLLVVAEEDTGTDSDGGLLGGL